MPARFQTEQRHLVRLRHVADIAFLLRAEQRRSLDLHQQRSRHSRKLKTWGIGKHRWRQQRDVDRDALADKNCTRSLPVQPDLHRFGGIDLSGRQCEREPRRSDSQKPARATRHFGGPSLCCRLN